MLVAGNDDCLVCVDTSTAYPGGNSEVKTLSSTKCNAEGKGPKQKSVTTEAKRVNSFLAMLLMSWTQRTLINLVLAGHQRR